MPNARLARFLLDEEGAVTVDWVVLTGAIVLFGALTIRIVIVGLTDTSSSVGAVLADASVPTLSFN